MLRYKIDVLDALKKAGYTQYILKKDKILGGRDVDKLRKGIVLGNIGLDSICSMLRCQPGKIIEWIPDERAEEKTESTQ